MGENFHPYTRHLNFFEIKLKMLCKIPHSCGRSYMDYKLSKKEKKIPLREGMMKRMRKKEEKEEKQEEEEEKQEEEEKEKEEEKNIEEVYKAIVGEK